MTHAQLPAEGTQLRHGRIERIVIALKVANMRLHASDHVGQGLALRLGANIEIKDGLPRLLHGIAVS